MHEAEEESSAPNINNREAEGEDSAQEDVGQWLAQNVLQNSDDESGSEGDVAPPLANNLATPWSQNIRKAARNAVLEERGMKKPKRTGIMSANSKAKKTVRRPVASDSDSDEPLSTLSAPQFSAARLPTDEEEYEATGTNDNPMQLNSESDKHIGNQQAGPSRELKGDEANETPSQALSNSLRVRQKKRRVHLASDSEPDESTPLSSLAASVGLLETADQESGTLRNGFLDSDSDTDPIISRSEHRFSEPVKRVAQSDSDEEGRQVKKVHRAVINDDDDDD